MIKTFKSTGIGNESPFTPEDAKEWRRKKEATRRFLEGRRRAAESSTESSASVFEERPDADDDAGTPDA